MQRTWLEIQTHRTGRTTRFCLDGMRTFLIGRNPECHFAAGTVGDYARRHAALRRTEKGWQLSDLGSAGGTVMNGMQMRTARQLDSGDVFKMNGRHTFRLVVEALDPRWEEHASRLALGSDDDASWLVFADALQELKDPRGAEMAEAGNRVLGELGLLVSVNTLQFDGRFGFIRKLWISPTTQEFEPPEQLIEAALRQPAARFVRELQVNAGGVFHVQPVLEQVMNAAPNSLTRLIARGFVVPPGMPTQLPLARPVTVEWLPD